MAPTRRPGAARLPAPLPQPSPLLLPPPWLPPPFFRAQRVFPLLVVVGLGPDPAVVSAKGEEEVVVRVRPLPLVLHRPPLHVSPASQYELPPGQQTAPLGIHREPQDSWLALQPEGVPVHTLPIWQHPPLTQV